jgi:hypothetical protein
LTKSPRTAASAKGAVRVTMKLTALVVLAAVLSLGHTTDQVIRGDLRWQLSLKSASFILISLAIYTVVAGGLASLRERPNRTRILGDPRLCQRRIRRAGALRQPWPAF